MVYFGDLPYRMNGWLILREPHQCMPCMSLYLNCPVYDVQLFYDVTSVSYGIRVHRSRRRRSGQHEMHNYFISISKSHAERQRQNVYLSVCVIEGIDLNCTHWILMISQLWWATHSTQDTHTAHSAFTLFGATHDIQRQTHTWNLYLCVLQCNNVAGRQTDPACRMRLPSCNWITAQNTVISMRAESELGSKGCTRVIKYIFGMNVACQCVLLLRACNENNIEMRMRTAHMIHFRIYEFIIIRANAAPPPTNIRRSNV